MPEKFSSTHFLRIMRLPEKQRRDLLEFIGQTTVDEAELERMIRRLEHQDGPQVFKAG